jgi:hypothetical protein
MGRRLEDVYRRRIVRPVYVIDIPQPARRIRSSGEWFPSHFVLGGSKGCRSFARRPMIPASMTARSEREAKSTTGLSADGASSWKSGRRDLNPRPPEPHSTERGGGQPTSCRVSWGNRASVFDFPAPNVGFSMEKLHPKQHLPPSTEGRSGSPNGHDAGRIIRVLGPRPTIRALDNDPGRPRATTPQTGGSVSRNQHHCSNRIGNVEWPLGWKTENIMNRRTGRGDHHIS